MAADAVKRSAAVARELGSPQRALAPLRQVLDLPRQIVRQGLERAWDLGRDFLRLAQVSESVLRPLRVAIQWLAPRREEGLEPSLEKTLLPRRGPSIGR
ncbi:MAG: hypothetical protein HYR61_16995 [Acidobacteria bacterium]|nr:hypothetical protein [Acidobacteriota bacterium]